jgi:hypothetical protein
MSVDYDLILIDTLKAKMCHGCKHHPECHPPESESVLELVDVNQMCMCADENVKNTYRPEQRYSA